MRAIILEKMVRSCGPQKWRISTLENIDTSDVITKKINASIEKGKKMDPLPTLREQEQISRFLLAIRLVQVEIFNKSISIIHKSSQIF